MVSRYVPDMGDLIWVDFDPTKGSEQAGHRPAVVLSPFMYLSLIHILIVVGRRSRYQARRF